MTNEIIRTVFLGSNWEAVPALEKLVNSANYNVVGVITKPDRPVGRSKTPTPNIVKETATRFEVPVFHTENDPENYEKALKIFHPDLLVVLSFGELIPAGFLSYPKYGAINIHFSLLPKYRGATPIQKSILNGDTKTGVTFVQMVEELDAGPILQQYEIEILPDDTNQSLREKLVRDSAELLIDVLDRWVTGKIKARPQDDDQATYCWKRDIAKENAMIDWERDDAETVGRMVRAYVPWPIAWTYTPQGERIKLYEVRIVPYSELAYDPSDRRLGEMFKEKNRLFVKTLDEDRLLEVLEIQRAGKRKLRGSEFNVQ